MAKTNNNIEKVMVRIFNTKKNEIIFVICFCHNKFSPLK